MAKRFLKFSTGEGLPNDKLGTKLVHAMWNWEDLLEEKEDGLMASPAWVEEAGYECPRHGGWAICPFPNCENGIGAEFDGWDIPGFDELKGLAEVEGERQLRLEWKLPNNRKHYVWHSYGKQTTLDHLPGVLSKWIKSFVSDDRQEPEHLYHYTSGAGACGILESRELWLTAHEYLNDQSEISHGGELISSAFEKSTLVSGIVTSDFSAIKEDFYICSFSTKPDDLALWRSYCASNAGASIGFRVSDLTSFTLSRSAQRQAYLNSKLDDTFLVPVLYENSRKRMLMEKFTELIEYAHSTDSLHMAELDLELKNPLSDVYDYWCSRLSKLLSATMKDENFRYECEWRLIYFSHRAMKIKVRLGGGNRVIPYISSKGLVRPDIVPSTITVAPMPDRELQVKALAHLVDGLDFPEKVVLDHSNIPYREYRWEFRARY